ncbi:MAG: DegT/DnrJ/EryC1/StrS family aminotransferase [Candidatus Marinimicrobia bacterium]|nr:DegT/DnrJ/EryC1/StrS family aminotransferase [Candidatus Neomarinimicrobiota bacterium]
MKKREKQIGVGTLEISPLARKYVNDVLDTNRLSYGPYSEKFERRFAEIHNRKFGIFCNSGTSALQVSLAVLKEMNGWQDGDEVIVPAVTFVATSNIVLQNNMTPVFVDVSPVSYNIAPQKIEEAITSKTKAIIPVNLFGLSCEIDEIKKIAQKYNLKIIEDSCEAMFVEYKGRPVGSMSDIACFSTYVAHLLVTGVGGLILTDDPQIAILARSICNHGRDSIYLKIDDDQVDDSKRKNVIAGRFNFERMGYSFRATELEAAIGLAQLEENYLEDIKQRQTNAFKIAFGLNKFGLDKYLQLTWNPYSNEHAFMMYPIVVHKNRKIKRDDLVNYLECHNIETRPMLPLLNQPFYKKKFGDIEKNYPVAKWINNNGFYIGCHQGLSNEDIEYIIEVFKNFFEK